MSPESFWLPEKRQRQTVRFLLASLISMLCIQAAKAEEANAQKYFEAAQAAEILGVEQEFQSILAQRDVSNDIQRTELLRCRTRVLEKVLLGYLENRADCSKIDLELAYAYELGQRQQDKVDEANQLFNFVNFLQSGTLYGIEGRSKLHHQDKQSYILTTIGAGLSAALPAANLLYNKHSRVGKFSVPKVFHDTLDGEPVSLRHLSEIPKCYMDKPAWNASTISRKQEMNGLWKKRYAASLEDENSLCGLKSAKARTPSLIKKRIVLLWSLHTFLNTFDRELLALLDVLKDQRRRLPEDQAQASNLPMASSNTRLASSLLGIEAQVGRVEKFSGKNNMTALEDELEILEETLRAMLSVQSAVGKINSELNYSFDVVLAELNSRRNKVSQRVTQANFINKGTLNAIGGFLDLKTYTKAADEVFICANGTGMAISTFALHASRGEKRTIDIPENSLAEFFGLQTDTTQKLPSLVRQFLNAKGESSGKTNKEQLLEIWKRNHVSSLNPENAANQKRLAGFASSRFDTIKIVTDRIALLQSLRVKISSFNNYLAELLTETTQRKSESSTSTSTTEGNSVDRTASLIGAKNDLLNLKDSRMVSNSKGSESLETKLSLLRKVMVSTLNVKSTAANIETEIARENQCLNRISRARDRAILLTNNLNFFQGYILGTILYGPLGLSSSDASHRASDRLKIIAGFNSIGLGTLSLLEHKLASRLDSVPRPSMLSACFNRNSPALNGFSPQVLQYLNTRVSDESNAKSWKEELHNYWGETKLLAGNYENKRQIDRVCALGAKRLMLPESRNLVSDRVSMLYDLRGVVETMDISLSQLLRGVD